MTDERELAQAGRAWPFEEARKIVAHRLGGAGVECAPDKGFVLFETGYGPSGLPHIGTFGEVARTTMVRQAFQRLSDIPTRLVAFSDDMDGLRKVPDNIPQPDMVAAHLGKPLTAIPDPFDTHESFGAHNNARLRAFLDEFGFDYEFRSATECYRSGVFDAALRRVLERYDEIMAIMLPTLREERRRTYSPVLPVSPTTGHVLQVPMEEVRPDAGTVVFRDEGGALTELPITGGHCKLQWKADWAMRWAALDVDYEMSGKDLIDSVRDSSKICHALGGRPPEGFNYELFLDENAEKISKSRGNGLTIEEWLTYGTPESLSLYMFQKPKAAKRLYFDVIPKAVDDYLGQREAWDRQSAEDRLGNPVWHIHDGAPPPGEEVALSFSILLNLASACNAEDASVLWGFITRYAPQARPDTAPVLDRLVGLAVRYYHDFVKPAKVFRPPSETERAALLDLAGRLRGLPADADGETIQHEVYAVGREHGFEPLRDWFRALYEVLMGQSQGPRFGSFVALYGIAETLGLIDRALAGELVAAE